MTTHSWNFDAVASRIVLTICECRRTLPVRCDSGMRHGLKTFGPRHQPGEEHFQKSPLDVRAQKITFELDEPRFPRKLRWKRPRPPIHGNSLHHERSSKCPGTISRGCVASLPIMAGTRSTSLQLNFYPTDPFGRRLRVFRTNRVSRRPVNQALSTVRPDLRHLTCLISKTSPHRGRKKKNRDKERPSRKRIAGLVRFLARTSHTGSCFLVPAFPASQASGNDLSCDSGSKSVHKLPRISWQVVLIV